MSWDGGRSIRIRDNEFTLAVDPQSGLSPDFEAAVVLITSEEGFDGEKLAEVCGRGTCVVLPEAMNDRMVPSQDVEFVRPGEEIDIYGVLIEAVKSNGSFSYRFSMRDSSFFVSPDSTDIEEVLELENRVNLAFLSATREQDLEDIVRNAVKIKPEGVVPYLYDGSRSLEGFKAELEDRNISCSLQR
ncbi:MAG: hypothetical protein ABEK10_00215 [Candidatus Nanosalina sp.]